MAAVPGGVCAVVVFGEEVSRAPTVCSRGYPCYLPECSAVWTRV